MNVDYQPSCSPWAAWDAQKARARRRPNSEPRFGGEGSVKLLKGEKECFTYTINPSLSRSLGKKCSTPSFGHLGKQTELRKLGLGGRCDW